MTNEHRPIITMYHEVVMFEQDCFHRAQKENNLKKEMEKIINESRKRNMALTI